jgi:hypothetical protein
MVQRLARLSVLLLACTRPMPTPTEPAPEVERAVEQLQLDAARLQPMMKSPLGHAFLSATTQLTPPAPRELLADPKTGKVVTKARASELPEAVRAALQPVSQAELEGFFYNTYHGTPLAYARAVDLLGQAGVEAGAGRRLADFGFGNVGQLRLFAALGFSATGIDVDPVLGDLYSGPGDQGAFGAGSVQVLIGRFPAEPELTRAVGQGLDVFLAKNTLKKGYVHPDRPPGKPEWVMDLGVSDDVFLQSVHDALKPHGRFLIYNICPAPTPAGQPFVTWTDGRSPYTRAQFEQHGFHVKAFDVDDTAFVRAMGHQLRWDVGEGKMDLVNDLSVLYTLVERE